MKLGEEFELLDKQLHHRKSFDCGQVELNSFIDKFAAKHMQSGISRTIVLPSAQIQLSDKYAICAFYTITISAIERETLPQKLARKLPRYPIPVYVLAQLAVDKTFQGQGLGKIALINSLEYIWNVNQHMSAYAVVVDCLNDDAQAFYLKYGFQVLCNNNGKVRMFMPMETVGLLMKGNL